MPTLSRRELLVAGGVAAAAGAVCAAAQALTHWPSEDGIEQPLTELLRRDHWRRFYPARSGPEPADLQHEVLQLKICERPRECHGLTVAGR